MKKTSIVLLLLVMGLLVPLTGCKKDSEATAIPITDVPIDDDDDTPVEDVLADTFYVVAYRGSTKSAYTSHTLVGTPSVDSSWATKCTVPTADFSTGAADIVCMVEAHELDIYYSGVSIKMSLPGGVCEYVREEPYIYFDYEPGVGPAGPYAWASTDPLPTSCPYNYTAGNGPNCCTGSWTMSVGADPVAQPARSGQWGGKFSNCLAGPNVTNFPKDVLGRPLDLIYQDDGAGIAFTRVFSAPIFQTPYPFNSNVHASNYFNPDDHLNVSNYTPTADLLGGTTAPEAFDSILDTESGYTFYPNPFHTYSCLDFNHEVKARIRVVVREWNSFAAMAQGGDPDTSGGPSTDPYNDFWDWADFDSNFPQGSK